MRWTEQDVEAYLAKRGKGGRVGCKETPGVHTPKVDRPSPYDSRLEERYAQYLELLLKAGEIKAYVHHPGSFRLPGKRNYHRPDFFVAELDGWLSYRNTKGYHKNMRDSLTKIKTAAALFPWFRWIIVEEIEGQWHETVVSPHWQETGYP